MTEMISKTQERITQLNKILNGLKILLTEIMKCTSNK